MKYICWLSICVVLVSTFSCKKDNPIINNPETIKEKPKLCRIISGPSFNYNKNLFFTYNLDSSIKSVISNYGSNEYNYEGGVLKRVLQNSYFYPFDSFETDQSSKITARHVYNIYDSNEPMVNLYNVWYIYGSENKIVQANYEILKYFYGSQPSDIIYGVYYYTYDAKGNLVKEVDSVKDDKGKFKFNYSALYKYDDKINPYYLLPLFPFSQNSNLIMMSPNNIISKEEYFANTTWILKTYTYTYSEEGYPTEVKEEYYPHTKGSVRYQYTYECK